MAQNISLWGASYSDVPSVVLPKTGGGTATFYDEVGSTTLTSNGTYSVTGLASVVVNVSGGGLTAQKILCGSGNPSSSAGNDGDVYIKLQSGATIDAYAASYTKTNINSSSSALENCIGVSAENGSSTSNVYSSGSSTTGIVDYSFDLSGIPSGVTVSSVSLVIKAHEENASRSVCTVQLYAGSTAKGSLTTVSGTSNALYTVDCGSWTRSELDSLIMRLSLGYYGGLIAGATLTIVYEMANPRYDVTLTGTASGWEISGSGMYKKTSGSWSSVSTVTLDDTVTRT